MLWKVWRKWLNENIYRMWYDWSGCNSLRGSIWSHHGGWFCSSKHSWRQCWVHASRNMGEKYKPWIIFLHLLIIAVHNSTPIFSFLRSSFIPISTANYSSANNQCSLLNFCSVVEPGNWLEVEQKTKSWKQSLTKIMKQCTQNMHMFIPTWITWTLL